MENNSFTLAFGIKIVAFSIKNKSIEVNSSASGRSSEGFYEIILDL